ncbi:MAG: hypothetical protein NTV01_16820 [Bacteroidia bacterium]|nr:hypothetical protein [Bacteroidia bacterium]
MRKFIAVVLCLGMGLAICNADSWAAEVKGNNSNWTASGTVDFGCSFGRCKDTATAGVTGSNAITTALHEVANVVGSLGDLSLPPDPNHPLDKLKQAYNAINKHFGSTQPVQYDEGGVWIKILTKSGNPYIGTQLYYYWANGINKYGLPITEDVTVFAKAHDGGRSPDATSGYGDNSGSYTVNIVYAALPATARPNQGNTVNPTTAVTEDCVPFNPNTTTVTNIQGRWKIVDGSRWLFDFGNKESDARQAFAIIKKYGYNQSCYVGRPQPSFQYLLHK